MFTIDTTQIAIIISVISTTFSVWALLRNNKRSSNKDIEERVAGDTRINMKLDNISALSAEIKNEISSMREDIKSHNDRLIKVEESVKSAHHRINTLEERMNVEKDNL